MKLCFRGRTSPPTQFMFPGLTCGVPRRFCCISISEIYICWKQSQATFLNHCICPGAFPPSYLLPFSCFSDFKSPDINLGWPGYSSPNPLHTLDVPKLNISFPGELPPAYSSSLRRGKAGGHPGFHPHVILWQLFYLHSSTLHFWNKETALTNAHGWQRRSYMSWCFRIPCKLWGWNGPFQLSFTEAFVSSHQQSLNVGCPQEGDVPLSCHPTRAIGGGSTASCQHQHTQQGDECLRPGWRCRSGILAASQQCPLWYICAWPHNKQRPSDD